MAEQILSWIIGLHPAGAGVLATLALVGTLRTVNKLLFTFLREVVKVTDSQYDDNLLAQVEKSKVYATVSYLLDWFASIKLPAKK